MWWVCDFTFWSHLVRGGSTVHHPAGPGCPFIFLVPEPNRPDACFTEIGARLEQVPGPRVGRNTATHLTVRGPEHLLVTFKPLGGGDSRCGPAGPHTDGAPRTHLHAVLGQAGASAGTGGPASVSRPWGACCRHFSEAAGVCGPASVLAGQGAGVNGEPGSTGSQAACLLFPPDWLP